MHDKMIFSPGSFFKGTKADLKTGNFLTIGMKKNYNDNRNRTKQPLKIVVEVTDWEGDC